MPGQSFWSDSSPPPGTLVDPSHPLARDLVGFCLPDSAGRFGDRSGRGLDARRNNGAMPLVPGPHGGPAAEFSSANFGTYIIDGGAIPTGETPLTLMVVCRLSELTGQHFVLSKTGPGADHWQIYAINTDSLFHFTGFGSVLNATAFGVVPLNTWVTVLAWRGPGNSAEVGISVNGKQNTTTIGPFGTLFSNGYIGGYRGTGNWRGSVALFACWSRMLGSDERAALIAQTYAMFAPPVWRRYFVPAAPAVTGRPSRLPLLGVA